MTSIMRSDSDGNVHEVWAQEQENSCAVASISTKLALDGLSTTPAVGTIIDTNILSDTTPAIILLGWYSGGKRHGGHFIVASCVTQLGQVVYLDPWGGQLNELGAGPAYPGGGQFEQILYVSASPDRQSGA